MRSTRPSRHGSPWTGLQHEQAVEGKEILLGYNEVVSGLQKNGEGLTTAEVEALMGALESVAINPSFVQRLLREHGGQASIIRAFILGTEGSGLGIGIW